MDFLSRVGGCRISDEWTYKGMKVLIKPGN